MRTVEMTTFEASGFSYETEDKGFEYPTQILEEPFSDVFEQYLTHTISDLGDHGHQTNDVDFPDFFTDGDTISSASYATDSTSGAPFPSTYSVPSSQKENTSSLTKAAFVPQNYHNRGRRERLLPAVSGLELLLDVEGRTTSSPHHPDPPHSAPATLTSLPLRRKPRFNKSKSRDLQDRDHRVSKPSIHQGKDQSNMIRPFYNHHLESPQSQEWAHGLEQLSLHSTISPFLVPPPHSLTTLSHHEAESADFQARHVTLRERFLQGETNRGYNDFPLDHTLSRVDVTLGKSDIGPEQARVREQEDSLSDLHERIQYRESERTATQRQPRHSASWAPSVSSSNDATLTFSTSQAEAEWNHGLPEVTSSCYTNGYASKSAPALPYQSYADGPEEDPRGSNDGIDAFINEDPSVDYVVENQGYLPLNDFNSNEYPPPPELDSTPFPQEQAHSSPRRISSPSAHPSPSHNRRRSKSTQRRKSAGNLKSSKSPITMDFVNFTPSDSRRILTGVAPSGSSKTKARREQEANEKKRKLSLAVLRAVEEAGGDPEPLRKGGLLADG
ncbi:MAG: hypothetical protein Q9216_004176 [Gyalolechia sp. 2 TL-2023]